MQIKTRYLGDVEIEEKQVIHFPGGLPAFEDHKKYVFLPFDDSGIFFYMQSIDNTELCLVVCDPFRFFPDYEIDLGEQECQLLEITEPGDIAMFAILTIPENFQETTANLLAPLVVNVSVNLGLQFIPSISDKSTKHPIFPPVPEQSAAAGERR